MKTREHTNTCAFPRELHSIEGRKAPFPCGIASSKASPVPTT